MDNFAPLIIKDKLEQQKSDMKRTVMILALGLLMAGGATAQTTGKTAQKTTENKQEVKKNAIIEEVANIERKELAIKNDTSKDLETRKVASFKADAIYYLMMKAGETDGFTDIELGSQTNAMIDFVNLFVSKYASAKKKSEREVLMARFKNASIENSLFGDPDKETVMAYVDNSKYITQFSIDTDWVKALEAVKSK